MYLKRIELYGFKSFADRTDIELSPGVTAIVGPNGSGKSNLSDAIRWALGEQSAKVLRGARMEDVIFGGSAARKPLGFAETTLVFDNTDGALRVDLSEVAVTRRVYRSGESEFLMCGAPCRLRDIQALFMDTGIGKEGYSVIEQGRIDIILAAGSSERRAFFEEAAGIHKYKARRAEAGRRLSLADTDIARLGDVTAEISRQMEPLAARAEAARQFEGYSRELTDLEAALALLDIESLEARSADIRRRMTEADGSLAAEAALRESLVSGIASDNAKLAATDEERERVLAQASECAAKIEAARGRAAVAKERVAAQLAQAQALEEALARDEVRLGELSRELAARTARLGQIGEELEAARGDLEAREAEDASLQEKHRLDAEIGERLKADLIEVLSEAADVRNELAKIALEEESGARRLERQRKEVDRALAELEEAEARAAREEARRVEARGRLSELASRLAELERGLDIGRLELKELVARHGEIEARMRERSLELGGCERLVQDNEWYPPGARVVLSAAREGRLHGIIGPVGDLVQVPRELELPIEAALGQAVSDIIVAKDAHARAAVRYLKEKGLGRATFLPLDLVSPPGLRASERQALSGDGVLGLASDLVSYDPAVRKAVEYVLGRTAVVRDLDAAVRLSRATATRLKVVTCDGEIVHPGGAISGGSPRKRSQGSPLFLKRRMAELRREVASLRGEHEKAGKAVDDCQARVSRMEKECGDLNGARLSLELEVARLEAREVEVQRDLDRARSRARTLQDELGAGAHEGASRSGAREDLERRYADLESSSKTLARTQESVAARLSGTAGAREALSRRIADIRVKIASLTQEASGIRQMVSALEAQRDELAVEMAAKEGERTRATQAVERAQAEMAAAEKELEELGSGGAELGESLARLKEQRKALARGLARAESRLRQCQEEIERVQKARADLAADEAGLAERARHLREGLARTCRLSPEEARKRFSAIADREAAVQRVERLRADIEALGTVDPEVLEVYQSLASRHSQLSAGLDDLASARSLVRQVIERADRESENRFRETLNSVRLEFGRVFARLFGGGRADLVLADAEGSAAPGVDVIAEPPGKKLQSLTLLSAGERALAAAALVFAILGVRPSPFCVLDEVDAALDEANVSRFVELLKEAAGRGQVIVVTHRKGTMEAADVLYGVTMEESGVSKLISVNLEDAEYAREQTA